MSKEDLNNFLEALDGVKESLSCVQCKQLCKDPVTLSKCFHMICSEHFDSLTLCPMCNVSLKDCAMWRDDKMSDAIAAAQELSEMFEPLREKNPPHSDSSVGSMMVGSIKLKSSNAPQAAEALQAASTSKCLGAKSFNTSLVSHNSNATKASKAFDKRNKKGETSLHIACRLGMLDNVRKMLSEGVNVNTKDNAGWTPLHEVVQNNHLDLVKLLLCHNVLVNVPGQGNETALHEAVRYNFVDIAKELVNYGGDINARNSKGDTPLDLASAELKVILKKVASERVITEESIDLAYIERQMELDTQDIRVYCVSKYRTVLNKLKVLAKHHSNLQVETKMSNNVTHLIVDADNGICVSSLDILQGIVNSLWILSSKWAMNSTEECLESLQEYEVSGVGSTSYNGPKRSRLNKYKQLPGIFDGCHFYLHNFNTKYEISDEIEITKAVLSKLISDAGGIVLKRVPNPESIPECEKLVPYHAKPDGKLVNCSHYIIYKDIYEPLYNMNHLKALPIGWLIECIEKYELCEPW